MANVFTILPLDVIRQVSTFHPLLCPPFTNKRLRRAVNDYLAGGDRKQRIVAKYGEISYWDVSNVTNMQYMSRRGASAPGAALEAVPAPGARGRMDQDHRTA